MSLKSALLRTRLSAALLAPALVGLAACDTSTDPIPPSGILFVLNANPQVPSAQMRIDAQGPLFNPALGFGNFCCQDFNGNPTLLVRESDVLRQIRFSSGTSTDVIAAVDLLVKRDSIYFLVLARNAAIAAQSELLIFRNNTTPPDATHSKLRIVHLAPAVEPTGGPAGTIANLDVYITAKDANLATATPTIANLAYGDIRAHEVLIPPTDTVHIRITQAGTKTPIIVDKKYNTALTPGSTDYLGVESTNTIFLLNSSTMLPVRAVVVGGI